MAKARGRNSKKLKPENELQEAIQDWLSVTYDFEQWRHHLNEVILACSKASTNGDQQAIATLRSLHEELAHTIKKLSSDIDGMDEQKEIDMKQMASTLPI